MSAASGPQIRLLIDTTQHRCAVGLAADARLLASASEPMRTGHAERLFPMARELLATKRHEFSELDGVIVATGPGTFSGIRIGVAAARGLALALGVPAIGVGVLTALGWEAARDCAANTPILAVNTAPMGRMYLQHFTAGECGQARAQGEARLAEAVVPPAAASRVIGSAAPRFGGAPHPGYPDLAALLDAGLALPDAPARPAPLYLRPADAVPHLSRRG